MSLLSRVQRGRSPMPPRILVFGTEGIGKSTFASHMPKPIFVQCEDGLSQIDCDKFPLATSFRDVHEALIELHGQEHHYQTIVVDSLSSLERLIWDAVCKDFGVKSIEKADGGYAKGYVHALVYWRQIVDLLDALRINKGMAVVLIAHAKVEKFDDPESSAYDRYSPRLHKHASALICEWADGVLFATRKFRTQTEDAGFNRSRTVAHAIGKEGGDRVLRCVGGPSCIAKNRFGIAEDLPLSCAALMTAIANHHS
jgi:hypothetical protein